jgi:hypothetical protein
MATTQFAIGPMMQAVGEYQASLKGHPNPPAPNITKFNVMNSENSKGQPPAREEEFSGL